jgi:hypothetical protein
MSSAVEAHNRAQVLVEDLRRRWTGLRWGPILLEEITLISPPDTWPPTIRLDFRNGEEHRRWEDVWDDDLLRNASLEAASHLWLAIIQGHMCEAGLM